MNTLERREKIYNALKKNQSLNAVSLSEMFNVSQMTIRRDLSALEESNLITRSYGKVKVIGETPHQEFPFLQRSDVNTLCKQQIGKTAINYLDNISSIYVDGSTTATEFIKCLPSNRYFTVFTNSMAALNILNEMPNIRIYAIGGFLGKDGNSFDGDTTVELVKQIFVDATFTSCSGFTGEGFFNDGLTGFQIKKIMYNNSSKNFILADHSKLNSHGLFMLAKWSKVDYLITDSPIEQAILTQIESQNTKVIW